jgi:hypothetical protein
LGAGGVSTASIPVGNGRYSTAARGTSWAV